MATGDTALISYDLADDSVWSLNIGCSGAVDIRIERIEDDELTTAWLTVLARGTPAVLVTPLAVGAGRRIVYEDGTALGHLSSPGLEADADAMARAHLAAPFPQSAASVHDGVELFFEVNQAPPALVVFGAGQDAVPLVRQAWALGFDVSVVDPRADYLQSSLFSGARLVLTGFDALSAAVALPRGSYVVVMSHHLERDRLALAYCLEHDPAYIGVLGPRARFERLLADLAADGITPGATTLSRVHSPVGLAIGAETPEEVAVSILAEILARRRGFEGGFLSGSTASLHRPADRRAFARS